MISSRRVLPLVPIALFMLLNGCMTNPYKAPPDVAAPPPTATVLQDGLAYQVLSSGSGGEGEGEVFWLAFLWDTAAIAEST